ncbi:hypothetical protein GN956_G1587 [Arapaima gigas]
MRPTVGHSWHRCTLRGDTTPCVGDGKGHNCPRCLGDGLAGDGAPSVSVASSSGRIGARQVRATPRKKGFLEGKEGTAEMREAVSNSRRTHPAPGIPLVVDSGGAVDSAT